METRWNYYKTKLLVTALIVVAFAWGLNHLDKIWNVVGYTVGILSPFILGGAVAFVLNVPMRQIEKVIRKLTKKDWKLNRALSITVSLAMVLLVIYFVASMIVPEIGRTLAQINRGIPKLITEINHYIQELTKQYPELSDYVGTITLDWEKLSSGALDFLRSGLTNIINSTVSMATSVIGQTMTAIIGVIFGIYILAQKEKLSGQAKRILFAYLPQKKAGRILEIMDLTHKTFAGFIAGQCTEAAILGILTYLTMSIFRMPYAVTIAVLIGFFALLPIVGAVVGIVVGAFMILVSSPIKAIWFVVMLLILQQIEGNVIYPRVVGKSVGLPGMWVLLAVTVGGSLMGIVGMLVFVPLFSVLYALLREDVNKRLDKKKVSLVK